MNLSAKINCRKKSNEEKAFEPLLFYRYSPTICAMIIFSEDVNEMKLNLPQLTATLSLGTGIDGLPLVLMAGGRPPKPDWLRKLAENNNDSPIWAIDRGIDSCHRAGIVPRRLLGDADSARSTSWEWAKRQGVPIDLFPAAKNLTDFQLALRLSQADYGNRFLLATGAFGGRLDHAFSLLHSLTGDGRPGCLADDREVMIILRSGETAAVSLHETDSKVTALSLLPLSQNCSGVTIDRVRWPLENAVLTRNLPYAVSNELLPGTKKISVSLTDGVLGIYLLFGSLKA